MIWRKFCKASLFCGWLSGSCYAFFWVVLSGLRQRSLALKNSLSPVTFMKVSKECVWLTVRTHSDRVSKWCCYYSTCVSLSDCERFKKIFEDVDSCKLLLQVRGGMFMWYLTPLPKWTPKVGKPCLASSDKTWLGNGISLLTITAEWTMCTCETEVHKLSNCELNIMFSDTYACYLELNETVLWFELKINAISSTSEWFLTHLYDLYIIDV